MTTEKQGAPSAEDLFWARLEVEIRQEIAPFRGVISVALKDLTSGRRFEHQGNVVQAAGSSIKIPILMELFRKASAGLVDLDAPRLVAADEYVPGSGVVQFLEGPVTLSIRNHAILMINLSDNISTNICTGVARMDDVNRLLREIGCHDTKLQRLMIGNPPDSSAQDEKTRQQVKDTRDAAYGRENITTANDMVRWLETLVEGRLVNRAVSDSVLAVLRKPKQSPIREGVTSPVSIASKTGGLEGARCEVALVEQARRPYILAVMTTFGVDDDNSPAITKVARAVHGYLGLWERYSEYGRGLPAWAFVR